MVVKAFNNIPITLYQYIKFKGIMFYTNDTISWMDTIWNKTIKYHTLQEFTLILQCFYQYFPFLWNTPKSYRNRIFQG